MLVTKLTEYMFGKRVTYMVVVFLFTAALIPPAISAGGSHDDFDEADVDISSLLLALNRTLEFMELSLEHSLDVDYWQEVDQNGGDCGYSDLHVRESVLYSQDARASVAAATLIMDDIKEDISSYEYIDSLFIPFHRTAVNLTRYSEAHQQIVEDLNHTVRAYDSFVRTGDRSRLRKGLEHIFYATQRLRVMNTSLERIQQNTDMLDPELFELNTMKENVTENTFLITYYRDMILKLLELFEILVEDIEKGEDGKYTIIIELPWDETSIDPDHPIFDDGDKIWDDIEYVIMYPTRITLELSKYYHYNEEVTVKGLFETTAPVDLTETPLSVPFGETIFPDENGRFELNYHTDDFEWGINLLEVSYAGSEDMKSAYASVEFHVSIPTEIWLSSDLAGLYIDKNTTMVFTGQLTNASSGLGISNETVNLSWGDGKLDGLTMEDGNYTISTSVHEMGLSRGLYTIYGVFQGRDHYRECISEPIWIYVLDNGSFVIEDTYEDIEPWIEDDTDDDTDDDDTDDDDTDDDDTDDDDTDDDSFFGIYFEDFIFYIIIILLLLLLIMLYISRRSEEELSEPVHSPVRTVLQRRHIPSAKNRDDIPKAYAELLDDLNSKGIVRASKGKTHRDILRELTERIGLKEHLEELTFIFERAFFSLQEITSSEIDTFNRAIKKITKEVYSR